MDSKWLESLVALVEEQSFSRAAQRLHRSQPSISHHLRQLETELNCVLIQRGGRGCSLTPAGRAYYEWASAVLEQQRQFHERWAQGQSGRVKLACSTVPGRRLVPDLYHRLRQRAPQLVLQISQADSQDVIFGVERGRYDLGLIGMPYQGEGLASLRLFTEQTAVLAAADFGLGRAKSLRLSAVLPRYPLILRSAGSASRREAEQLIQRAGLELSQCHICAYCNEPEYIRLLLLQKEGLALMPPSLVQDSLERGELRAYTLEDVDSSRTFYAICRQEQLRYGTLREVWETLQMLLSERQDFL